MKCSCKGYCRAQLHKSSVNDLSPYMDLPKAKLISGLDDQGLVQEVSAKSNSWW